MVSKENYLLYKFYFSFYLFYFLPSSVDSPHIALNRGFPPVGQIFLPVLDYFSSFQIELNSGIYYTILTCIFYPKKLHICFAFFTQIPIGKVDSRKFSTRFKPLNSNEKESKKMTQTFKFKRKGV